MNNELVDTAEFSDLYRIVDLAIEVRWDDELLGGSMLRNRKIYVLVVHIQFHFIGETVLIQANHCHRSNFDLAHKGHDEQQFAIAI